MSCFITQKDNNNINNDNNYNYGMMYSEGDEDCLYLNVYTKTLGMYMYNA